MNKTIWPGLFFLLLCTAAYAAALKIHPPASIDRYGKIVRIEAVPESANGVGVIRYCDCDKDGNVSGTTPKLAVIPSRMNPHLGDVVSLSRYLADRPGTLESSHTNDLLLALPKTD